MSAREDGGPALPSAFTVPGGTLDPVTGKLVPVGTENKYVQLGMSLRDHFAGLALQGYMANKDNPRRFDPKGDAEWAYTIADAMLEARK